MRYPIVVFVLAALACIVGQQSTSASITYVDAATGNTTLQSGASLVAGSNYTTGSGPGAMDNLWHLKTGVGNGNGVWTADELDAGSEDVVPLVTTITFPQAGGYNVYAYIWDSEDDGQDWDVRVRLGTSNAYSKFQASEAETADPARFTGPVVTSEGGRRLLQIPLGVVIVSAGGTMQVYIDDDATIGSKCTSYDGVGYEKVFGTLDERLIALDCNKTNSPGAPSQAMFWSVSGSSTVSQNSTNILKTVGSYRIQFSKTSTTGFDFRGANGDSTRTIPGGPTSLSFLVADFIGSRDGTINIGVSGLPAGTYLFRSFHLESFSSSNLGFAQGSNSTSANVLRAHINGSLAGIIQPTALGSAGLGTNFISDTDIPKFSFPIYSDGSSTVNINLSTVYTNGVDRFIFLNGLEIFATTP